MTAISFKHGQMLTIKKGIYSIRTDNDHGIFDTVNLTHFSIKIEHLRTSDGTRKWLSWF